jgi:hypothetical protein
MAVPERYKKKGFTKVGAKKKSTRPGKKWMVLAKKGDKYKVVHGGDSKMKDFSQHKNKERKDKFGIGWVERVQRRRRISSALFIGIRNLKPGKNGLR